MIDRRDIWSGSAGSISWPASYLEDARIGDGRPCLVSYCKGNSLTFPAPLMDELRREPRHGVLFVLPYVGFV